MGRLVQRGNKIGVFVFCGAINVCKTSVFELLKENFKDGLILIMGNNFSPLDCEDNTYPFIK